MSTCSVDGCDKPAVARGWCSRHWRRWSRHGDPLAGRTRHDSPEAAIAARTERDGDCLVWTGAKTANGYGQIVVDGVRWLVHRYAYARAHGPITEDSLIDHACWNRSCVNVEHLRAATLAQNGANRSGPQGASASGVRGVYPSGARWMARAGKAGKYHYGGTFETIKEAEAAVVALREELFGEYAGR